MGQSYLKRSQTVPILGALSGAAVNSLFLNHFQALAQGHFTVRRLERIYGKGTVRRAYDQLRALSAWPGRYAPHLLACL